MYLFWGHKALPLCTWSLLQSFGSEILSGLETGQGIMTFIEVQPQPPDHRVLVSFDNMESAVILLAAHLACC